VTQMWAQAAQWRSKAYRGKNLTYGSWMLAVRDRINLQKHQVIDAFWEKVNINSVG
jgi:hypothetical protein